MAGESAALVKRQRIRVSYAERMKEIVELVNKHGSISVQELFKKWLISPEHIAKLLRWTLIKYSYLAYDGEMGVLYIPERKTGG